MSTEKGTQYFLNEIPQNTGLKEVEHSQISVSDVFPEKFCEIANSYIKKLEGVLYRYDVVIFMARKAICFYKALLLNTEINVTPSCEIYSSRILSYNIWDKLAGKRVALVDDVVIRGSSLAEARKKLIEHGISVDIYISALMYRKGANGIDGTKQTWYDGLVQAIQKPFVHLDETDIYSYANYITRFIEASMLPYNIDQPTVMVQYKENQLSDFMCDHRLTDITSSVQRKYGIENKVIHYSGEILRPILGSVNINLNDVCVKLRVFRDTDSSQVLIFPIILFPVIPTEVIDHVYKHIQTEKLDHLIWNKNERIVEENKTKVLIYVLNHYILSRFLWCEKEHGRSFDYLWIDSNETILFSQSILESDFTKTTLYEKIAKLTMPYKWEQRTPVRSILFNEYLGAAYVMIFAGIKCREYNGNSQIFVDSDGKTITRKIITLQCLHEKLKKYAIAKQNSVEGGEELGEFDTVDLCIVSNIIDVLIDRGILVPEIVHTADGGIVRAYRCGEVAKLSDREFQLFSYMLSQYASQTWENDRIVNRDSHAARFVGKREAEQLCVLFFRNAAKDDLFEKLYDVYESDCEDCYSIYYTLYGPTISRAHGRRYEVNENETLVDGLTSYGYVFEADNDNYIIGEIESSELSRRWKRFADIFAYDMLFLKSCFPSIACREDFFNSSAAKSKYPSSDVLLQKRVLSRIRSFEELLTMMSIGENEMQRTLSIIAEIKTIADMKVEQVHAAMSYFKNHMDSICEGIWKSRCYVKFDLLEDIQEMLKLNKNSRDIFDISRIFKEYVDGSSALDRNEVIVNFLQDCGEFFYRAYHTVRIINEYSTNKINLEEKCRIPPRIKYEKHYKKLRRRIDSRYRQCRPKDRYRMAIADLQKLQREAMALLDICELYLAQGAFGYSTYFQSIIVCANNPDILSRLRMPIRDSNFNQTKTGCIGNSRFFRCYLVECIADVGKKRLADCLSESLSSLVSNLIDMDQNEVDHAEISIIYYSAQNWYESLFFSGGTCTGTFVEKIIKDITKIEKAWGRDSGIELYVCSATDDIGSEIKPNLFEIIDKQRRKNVQTGYTTSNYAIQPTVSKIESKGGVTVLGDMGMFVGSASGDFTGMRKD